MKDFNSYVKNNRANSNGGNGGANGGNGDNYGDVEDVLTSLARKYEGADEDELIAAIFAEAERGRKNGTLSDADIDNFARTVSPMLNDKQRKRLESIVRHLKQK